MKVPVVIIFFSVVIGIFSLINYYIIVRAQQTIPASFLSRRTIVFIVAGMSMLFIVGKVLERSGVPFIPDVFVWIGALWVGWALYLFFSLVLIDFIRLLNAFYPFIQLLFDDLSKLKVYTAVSVLIGTFMIVLFSFINTKFPVVRDVEIEIPKYAKARKELTIVAASDLHISTLNNKAHVRRLVNKMNMLNPDIVLLAGDLIDDNLDVVKRSGAMSILKELKSEFGTYVIPGNHEYISGAFSDWDFYRENGLTLLKDSVILLDDSFYLAGRDDRETERLANHGRMDLDMLVKNIDFSKPVILMDHQPFNLEHAVDAGIDLQISGHTHNGQFWPITYIIKAMYEIGSGYLKKGSSHFYVSSGYGSSGTPIRNFSRPEIVRVKIRFTGDQS